MSDPKTYTAEEANALLPAVRALVESLRDAQAAMEQRHEQVEGSAPTNGGGRVHREFLEASVEAASAMNALAEMGVIVREPDSGLVDFPSERDGDPVYLCWRLGEDRVAFWHAPEAGFAGREPL